jgi:hypothetical protein
MDLGRGARTFLLSALALSAVVLFAAGCGANDDPTDVVEGEPLELGDLSINVQLTRFLNPTDAEDSEYLADVPAAPPGKAYLAVFMKIDNEGDDTLKVPRADQVYIEDTTGQRFAPTPSDTVFALPLGADLEGDESLPTADTAAAEGPVQGSIVLFLIPTVAEQNRPLEMHLSANDKDGKVELDL